MFRLDLESSGLAVVEKTIFLMIAALAHVCALAQDLESIACNPKYTPAATGYPFQQMTKASYVVPDNAVIDKLHVITLPIFDESNSKENAALYRFANRFHIDTRHDRIEDLVLFSVDDVYDERILEESERLLRKGKYLNDADIRPVSICDDRVEIEIITRDVWSFTPELSYSRNGGESKYRFGIRETNLLGQGVELAVRHKRDLDRDSSEFVYKDENIAGTRLKGRVVYSNNDDGSEKQAVLSSPFFSLDARRAWALAFEEVDRTETQYFRGNDVSEVDRSAKDYQISYGISKGLSNGVARRWTLGYRFEEEKFSLSDELPPPVIFPTDKSLSYPFIGFSSIEDKFVTSFNYDDILRTEDLNLGVDFQVAIGYAAEAMGSDSERLVVRGRFSDTLFYRANDWLSHQASWAGLYNLDTHETEDLELRYMLEFFNKQTKHRSFYASLRGAYTHNLNTNRQHFLGGETGARAFDNRFQIGDRSLLLTLEERMYTDIHLFNLVRVGWAVFVDAGRAWQPGVDDGLEDDYLANIGIGLRLASSKSDVGSVMHVDLSFPLTNKNDPEVDSSQFSVSLKKHF